MDDTTLTNDQLRLLGAAVAVAEADGVLDSKEFNLIGLLAERLALSDQAKHVVNEMLVDPPSPEEIAELAVDHKERLATYFVATQVAWADGEKSEREQAILDKLAEVLQLSAEDVEMVNKKSGG